MLHANSSAHNRTGSILANRSYADTSLDEKCGSEVERLALEGQNTKMTLVPFVSVEC